MTQSFDNGPRDYSYRGNDKRGNKKGKDFLKGGKAGRERDATFRIYPNLSTPFRFLIHSCECHVNGPFFSPTPPFYFFQKEEKRVPTGGKKEKSSVVFLSFFLWDTNSAVINCPNYLHLP